jgi:hypothetical protein
MENCDKGPQLERIEAKLDKVTEIMIDNAEIHQTLAYHGEMIGETKEKVDRIYAAPTRIFIAIFVGVSITVFGAIILSYAGIA